MKIALRLSGDISRRFSSPFLFRSIVRALLFYWLGSLVITPSRGGPPRGDQSPMESTRLIALALSQYAADHGGKYPEGASSTEVFQKLLDGNYVTDPATFYLFMPGKTQPTGSRLQPQNVCYDLTAGVNAASPENLPVVFVTGFRLHYQPDGQAVSLTRPFPAYAYSADAWMKWLTGGELEAVSGLPVAMKDGEARLRPGQIGPDGFGFVPNVLPADLEDRGSAYRQLTPTGSL